MLKILYINFWKNENNPQDRWMTKFFKENINENVIEINENSNDAPDILISSCFGNIKKMEKYKNIKLKIFFYGENLDRYPPYNNMKLLQIYFDVILGFKYTNKNDKLYRLPLWITYYPFYNFNNENNIINFLNNNYLKNINEKNNNNAALICRHDRNGVRSKILNEVQKYTNVLCPGKFNNNCAKIGNSNNNKINFLKQIKYNICPENSCFEGYFTEKIFQALECGCIPIYWGIDIPEKDILNPDSYCFVSNDNIKQSINHLFSNNENYKVTNIFTENAKDIINTYYTIII